MVSAGPIVVPLTGTATPEAALGTIIGFLVAMAGLAIFGLLKLRAIGEREYRRSEAPAVMELADHDFVGAGVSHCQTCWRSLKLHRGRAAPPPVRPDHWSGCWGDHLACAGGMIRDQADDIVSLEAALAESKQREGRLELDRGGLLEAIHDALSEWETCDVREALREALRASERRRWEAVQDAR